mgnify:CR=1 FL=1
MRLYIIKDISEATTYRMMSAAIYGCSSITVHFSTRKLAAQPPDGLRLEEAKTDLSKPLVRIEESLFLYLILDEEHINWSHLENNK